MKISTVARHVREGARSLARNGWMTFASISALAIALFMVGSFVLLAANVNELAEQVENEVEVRVFLGRSVDAAAVKELESRIASIPAVREVKFVSKEEALEDFIRKADPENKETLEELRSENPLPDSFVVRTADPRDVAGVVAALEAMNGERDPSPFEKISYAQGTVEKLVRITDTLRNVGLIVVVLLSFSAVFLISNTIQLTIFARQREIAIMRLVGATSGFIRGPFFFEGLLVGLIGSTATALVLLAGYAELVRQTELSLGLPMFRLIPVGDIGWKIAALLVALGLFVGVWGSVMSIRKFLRV